MIQLVELQRIAMPVMLGLRMTPLPIRPPSFAPAELIVTRPEYHRHAAVTDLPLQHVLADPGARAEVAPLPWQVADHSTSG